MLDDLAGEHFDVLEPAVAGFDEAVGWPHFTRRNSRVEVTGDVSTLGIGPVAVRSDADVVRDDAVRVRVDA